MDTEFDISRVTDPELLQIFKHAERIVFFTGAGISAESGIPTFRGTGGIWNDMNPEELASFNGFMKNPTLVWKWYQYRRDIIHNTKPNPGHHAIKEFEDYYSSVIVITQNIDGLHRRAGSTYIRELHGNITRNYCINCGEYANDDFEGVETVPACEHCGGMIRPDVVWFGERLNDEILESSFDAALKADVLLVVGTSAIVYPAAGIAFEALRKKVPVIEINLEDSPLSSDAAYTFRAPSGVVLPALLDQIKKVRGRRTKPMQPGNL
ncbi:NAD-dependent protein deacylase [Anaerolineae bacterium]|nr:NAD-dependent protein deacylase [Anaerolineae bacterium]